MLAPDSIKPKTFRWACPQNHLEGSCFTFQSVLYTLQVNPPTLCWKSLYLENQFVKSWKEAANHQNFVLQNFQLYSKSGYILEQLGLGLNADEGTWLYTLRLCAHTQCKACQYEGSGACPQKDSTLWDWIWEYFNDPVNVMNLASIIILIMKWRTSKF